MKLKTKISLQSKLTDTVNGKMLIYTDDPTIGRSLDLYGEYCQPEIELLKNLSNKTTWFVDIGANIGTHTIPMSYHVDRVIAFEPDDANFDLLSKNVAGLCAIRKNVTATKMAIGDTLQEVNTQFDFGKTKIVQGTGIKSAPLDILGLPKVDLVKIDVEGQELKVLVGMRNILIKYKPDMLIEMQDETTYNETFDFLESCNYKAYWFPVSTYSKNNQKNNTDDVFGPTHGVINWICTAYQLNTELEPVVDRDDTVERMVYRRRENVGNDRKDGR